MSGWLGMLLMTGGLTALTTALAMLSKNFVFYLYSAITNGKIIDTEYVESRARRGGSAAVIEFTAQNEKGSSQTMRFTAAELKKASAHRIGAKVRVRYVPQKPEIAKINSFAEIWLEPLAGIALGLALTAVGLAFLGKLLVK